MKKGKSVRICGVENQQGRNLGGGGEQEEERRKKKKGDDFED